MVDPNPYYFALDALTSHNVAQLEPSLPVIEM